MSCAIFFLYTQSPFASAKGLVYTILRQNGFKQREARRGKG